MASPVNGKAARAKPAARAAGKLRVLVVEDIPTMAAAIQAGLMAAGMEVELALTGAEAIERKASFKPEVVLVDLELPDMGGIELVERFSAEGDCGVIVVTANDEEGQRIAGLDTGADDYMVKPVPGRELVARIRAVHRRMSKPSAMRQLRIYIDLAQRCLVSQDGKRTLLTEAELSALETLLDAAGSSVARDWLSRTALKRPLHADDRAVDQLVMKLRRKLQDQGASERVILSARRQGYMIADPSLFRMLDVPAPAVEPPLE